MRQIIELALKELKSLFYTPVGWITLIVFAIHTALILFGRIDNSLMAYESRGIDVDYYTMKYFTGYSALFHFISSSMFLYIPLITMGLLSKEYSQGTIKLLFSSPIKTYEIILGKFLCITIYALFMVFILIALTFVVRFAVIDTIDSLVLIKGFIRIYLLICFYVAIGLFVSSLTSYQLIAAVGTFASLFVLNSYINILVQDSHPVIIQNLFGSFLPPRLRLETFNGLLNLADFYYFIILTTLFVVLAYLRLHFMRGSKSVYVKSSVYGLVVVFFLGIGLYTNNPDRYVYIDMTDKKLNSPSKLQAQLLAEYNQPVKLVRYYNILERPHMQSIRGFLGYPSQLNRLASALKVKPIIEYRPFLAHSDNMHIAFVELDSAFSDATVLATERPSSLIRTSRNSDLESLKDLAKEKFSWLRHIEILSAEDVQNDTDLFDRRNQDVYYFTSDLDTVVLNIGSLFPSDQEISVAIKSMIYGQTVIGVATNNGEISFTEITDRSYQRLLNEPTRQFSLINQGFEIREISILPANLDEIDILIIADPHIDYSNSEIENIISYLDSGGNAYFASSDFSAPTLNRIIDELGLQYYSSTSRSQYSKISTEAIKGFDTYGNGFLENHIISSIYRYHRLIKKEGESYDIHTPNALGLSFKNGSSAFNVYPIIQNETDTLMYALVRSINGKEQRIIVSGTAFAMSNGADGIGHFSPFTYEAVNFVLGVSLFRWLSNDEYPLLLERELQDELLVLKQPGLLKVSVMAGMTLPLILFGLVVLYKRKRK